MEPIVIISGKCSPGKTTLTALFTSLAKNKVIADCDVGAPDLHRHRHRHLLLKPGSPGNAGVHLAKVAPCSACRSSNPRTE